MKTDIERQPERTPVLRKAAAGAVLIVAAALAIKIVIGFVTAIFWTVVIVAVVAAVIWAVKTIAW